MRLPLFPQPLGRALKKRSAAPASPPCFRRRRRSAPLLFESTRLAPGKVITKQKLQYPVRILEFLVGAGGFEPPKLKAADLQSVPIGHSGTRPYSFVVHPCAGRLAYCSMRTGICQPPFFTFFRQCKRDRQLLPAAAFHARKRGCCTVCSSPFLPISYFSTAPRFALVTMRA